MIKYFLKAGKFLDYLQESHTRYLVYFCAYIYSKNNNFETNINYFFIVSCQKNQERKKSLHLVYICTKIFSMNTINRTKINRLVSNWPKGTIGTVSFFQSYDVGYDLLNYYKKANWVEAVGNRAYKLFGDDIDWYGAIYAFQKQLDLSIHPGGKTALQLLGYAHYLSEKLNNLYLFGYRGEKLPAWFRNYNWEININYSANQLFPENLSIGYTDYSHKNFTIKIASAERATLEMLYYFPKQYSFDECYLVTENLVTLRPKLCQELLEHCNSIKVKRLFLFMAENNEHSWFEDLEIDKIDLGKGKRALVENGSLINKYNITVPKKYC